MNLRNSSQISPSENQETAIVIIGASLGGTATLRKLQKVFRGKRVQFLMIEKNQDFIFHDVATRSLVSGSDFAQSAVWNYKGKYLKYGEGNVQMITATVVGLHSSHLVLHDGKKINFDYCVIASGCHASNMNPFVPISVTSKNQALEFYNTSSKLIENAQSLVLVGGGPSSCELAAEIKLRYPQKSVTLVHSRITLLSSDDISQSTKKRLESKLKSIGVQLYLNEKVQDIPQDSPYKTGSHIIRTKNGTEIESDMTFYCISKPCPSSSFLLTTLPNCIDDLGFIKVKPTLQVDEPEVDRIFAMGDVAGTGAPKMTRVLQFQADIVSKNVYIHYKGRKNETMIEYKPPKDNLIGIPLGRFRGVVQLPFLPSFIAPIVEPFIDVSIGFLKNSFLGNFIFSKLFGFS